MANITPRPRTKPLLQAWQQMIAEGPTGANFNFSETNRTVLHQQRIDAFIEDPTRNRLEELWAPESLVAAQEWKLETILNTWSGDITDLAEFLRELRDADTFSTQWEEKFLWKEPLWECYSRLHAASEPIVSQTSIRGLGWFGIKNQGSFEDRSNQLAKFIDFYEEEVGHVTAETPYSVPLQVEVDELLHTVTTVDRETVLTEHTGSNHRFYRQLYGGIPPESDGKAGANQDTVTWIGTTPVLKAYAKTKRQTGYRDEGADSPHWGGNWESWKESFARYVDEIVRQKFNLTALDADDIGPLFNHLEEPTAYVDEAWPDLPDWVVTHLMGGHAQRKLAWRDAVDRFESNPEEGAAVLSDFFNEELRIAPRLAGFREFTLPLTHENREHPRSEGDYQRMATSLLMLAFPDRHIGIQYQRLNHFVTDFTALDGIWTNFEPQRYSRFVPALRDLRDDLAPHLDEEPTMLDIHNIVYIYWEEGEPKHFADDSNS